MKTLQQKITFPVLVGLISAILIALIWFAFFSRSKITSGSSADSAPELSSESGGWILNQAIVDTSRRIFDENGNWLSFDELIRYASNGEINLISELSDLRRQCPENVHYEQCNEIIRAFISDHYFGKDTEYLMKLFSNYLRYELKMKELELSDKLNRAEKYELIKKQRREFFSDKEAKLIFGLEEAEETYLDSLGGFLKDTETLNGEQRIQKYEEFRKNVYGQYYNTIKKREPKYNTYETEIFLREKELEKMNIFERNSKTRQIREKYFGKDGADRMETVYKESEEKEKKEKQTAQQESDWTVKNPNVKGEAKEKALMEIRINNLGKEEAEEYSRRLKYEEEIKK
ncbi:lipase secretion chaperone [Leptospira noguchii]|uniref:lipase secretion chaperone n=1 Tax=Leptospira noguchii TaxID=28182 RepID=UPI000774C245|nr:lipase secretion chaperone [Leptospira noguchii]